MQKKEKGIKPKTTNQPNLPLTKKKKATKKMHEPASWDIVFH